MQLVWDNGLGSTIRFFSLLFEDVGTRETNESLLSTAHRYHMDMHRKISNIRRTLVGNENVDHWDVVGASTVGAAPTTSSF